MGYVHVIVIARRGEGYSQNIRSTIIQGQVQRRVLWWKPEIMGYEYYCLYSIVLMEVLSNGGIL